MEPMSYAELMGTIAIMYRQKYIPLREAVGLGAKLLAETSSVSEPEPLAVADQVRKQLVQALYDGVVGAEGVRWELVEPNPYEPDPAIPADRVPIARVYWANEKCQESRVDELGEATTVLDSVTVHWNGDAISWDNEFGDPCAFERIRVVLGDIEKVFSPRTSIEGREVSNSQNYRTGVAGRPTSKHLALEEMRRRASEGNLCGTLAAEVRELRNYIAIHYPEAPQPEQNSLENSLRSEYWPLRNALPDPPRRG